MPQYETVEYSIENDVATVALNRPDRLNAVNPQLKNELLDALVTASDDRGVRVIILTGNGRAFCAGADLKPRGPVLEDALSTSERIERTLKPIVMTLCTSPKPVIGAIRGAAAGVGGSFALACDLVVMEPGAYILQAFGGIGLIPDGGASWLLTRQLGAKRAYELIVGGERLYAHRCLELGLVNRVVPPGSLMTEARSLADMLRSKAPLAVSYAKRVVQEGMYMPLSDAISLEARYQAILTDSEDHREGRRAFNEKRHPVWKGR